MQFENLVIFGVGAIGSNTLMNIIYDLPLVNITIVDMDKVEQRNFSAGTQPYSKNDLNKFKTQALQILVYSKTGKKINIINKEITSTKDVKEILQSFKNVLVLDSFDNVKSRNFLNKIGYEVLHAGFSPNMTGEIVWDDMWNMTETKKINTIDICTQQGARSFIMSLTSILGIVITDFYYNNKKINLYFDKNLTIKILK